MDKNELKKFVAARTAKELKDGDVVNLGIGLPTMIPAFLSADVHVTFQSENGIVGTDPKPDPTSLEPIYVTDAGGRPAMVACGGSYIDSAASFGLIRGGHVDATILGALEVDREGNLANWIIPGKMVPGMGGAMDLVVGAKTVIVAMEHTAKGQPKIFDRCRLPLTAVQCVNLIITEMAVIRITPEGPSLEEFNPEFSLEDIQAATATKLLISNSVRPMV
jgi:acetate CoA/acetoacetate CoA-transferase beta subunit